MSEHVLLLKVKNRELQKDYECEYTFKYTWQVYSNLFCKKVTRLLRGSHWQLFSGIAAVDAWLAARRGS